MAEEQLDFLEDRKLHSRSLGTVLTSRDWAIYCDIYKPGCAELHGFDQDQDSEIRSLIKWIQQIKKKHL